MREYSPKINELESKEDCSLLFKPFFFFFLLGIMEILQILKKKKKNQVSQVYRQYTTGDYTISNAGYINQ